MAKLLGVVSPEFSSSQMSNLLEGGQCAPDIEICAPLQEFKQTLIALHLE